MIRRFRRLFPPLPQFSSSGNTIPSHPHRFVQSLALSHPDLQILIRYRQTTAYVPSASLVAASPTTKVRGSTTRLRLWRFRTPALFSPPLDPPTTLPAVRKRLRYLLGSLFDQRVFGLRLIPCRRGYLGGFSGTFSACSRSVKVVAVIFTSTHTFSIPSRFQYILLPTSRTDFSPLTTYTTTVSTYVAALSFFGRKRGSFWFLFFE